MIKTLLLSSILFINNVNTLPEALCKVTEDCRYLAEVGYFESRGESDEGVESVMKVVVNRMNHERFPSTIKEVILFPHAFSYVHDGSLSKAKHNEKQWQRMYRIALKVLYFPESVDVGGATHYHTKKVKPGWSKKFKQVASVGNHKFYKCSGYC